MKTTYTTYPIAATAYLPHDERAKLTHIVQSEEGATWDGRNAAGELVERVLCGRVRLKSILFDGALASPPEAATCEMCARRYAKRVIA